jgi:glycosyltransferase involved in cell wall biosynthesis
VHTFFDLAVEPVLQAAQARDVVEIGCFEGRHTRLLLGYCRAHGGRLHAIDPADSFQVLEPGHVASPSLVIHAAESLHALPRIPRADVVLLDGDHNWYTVYHELRLIEKSCRSSFGLPPVILLHDVLWPYGRRDVYFRPESIPLAHRQPFARGGVLPGREELTEEGLNSGLCHALSEGGPKNGVMTAVEDFLDQSKFGWHLVLLRAHFGLAILAPRPTLEACPDIRRVLEDLQRPETTHRLVRIQENINLELWLQLQALKRQSPHRNLKLSVVVVVHNMQREAPRTLHSLSPRYQRGIEEQDYEVIVVENNSTEPLSLEDRLPDNFRYVFLEGGGPSPAAAVNKGLQLCSGDLIGLLIDGARLASPGLLNRARTAAAIHPRCVIATPGWLLGHGPQGPALSEGRYSLEEEDRLLQSINWPEDGYRLFDVSVLQGSNPAPWFAPMAESNALFLPRSLWHELGGVDEAFDAPGGGFVNLDLYSRVLALPEIEHVMLLGEGVFHQAHGGIATNASERDLHSRLRCWHDQYMRLRGHAYRLPDRKPLAFGCPHSAIQRHIRQAMVAGDRHDPDALERVLGTTARHSASEKDQQEPRSPGSGPDKLPVTGEKTAGTRTSQGDDDAG